MRKRERRDLPQQRAYLPRQQEQPQHEKDMIHPQWHHLPKADRNEVCKSLPRRRPAAGRQLDRRADRAPFEITAIGFFDPLLAQHQHAQRRGPADLHRRRARRQRGAKPQDRRAGKLGILDRGNLHPRQFGFQVALIRADRDLRGHLGPEGAKPGLKVFGRHRPQGVIGRGNRRPRRCRGHPTDLCPATKLSRFACTSNARAPSTTVMSATDGTTS